MNLIEKARIAQEAIFDLSSSHGVAVAIALSVAVNISNR